MFHRLRNKFLLLNMIIISVLLLSAFSMVYFFTLSQTQRNIDMRLSRTMETERNFRRNIDHDSWSDTETDTAPPDFFPPRNDVDTDDRPVPLALDFTMETDAEGTIVEINSIFDIDQEVYTEIAAEISQSDKNSGDLKVADIYWAYRRQVLDTGGTRIGVLDISQEKRMLQNLIFTFSWVGLLALVVIFLISRFFANRTIHPIAAAWEKQNQFIADASHELKTFC